MDADDSFPDDVITLKAMLRAERAARLTAEAEAQAPAIGGADGADRYCDDLQAAVARRWHCYDLVVAKPLTRLCRQARHCMRLPKGRASSRPVGLSIETRGEMSSGLYF
jgi:hypothetical protein